MIGIQPQWRAPSIRTKGSKDPLASVQREGPDPVGQRLADHINPEAEAAQREHLGLHLQEALDGQPAMPGLLNIRSMSWRAGPLGLFAR